jgi:hypothetical protein
MSVPKVYGLLLGLIVVIVASVTTVSSAPRQSTAPTADETWTIPGAGLTPGLNDTRFVSDLALTNLGVATANVTVSFIGPGGLPAQSFTIAAGATTTYRNVIDALWDITGVVGALSVHSDQPLVLRARTYNTAATGTFGVALPVYASGQLLAEGQTADTLWIQQDPSGSSGFRTNVGVVFPDATGGEAMVTFYDAGGTVVGGQTYSSASAGFQQLSIASVAPAGLLVGRAQISVTRGRAAGYAVGVDNVTGDTSLYPFEALPAGVQDVVVNGVARLNGRNDTFFRTDARFYNQTPEDATLTVRFHAAGASNPNPQSATVSVPAGRIIEVVDVLGSILNAPVGSGGAARFTADQPVAILCRTSNVDPQGVQPGTFGAQQHPVPLASFLSSADAGAVVTAIRQDASFRTNVGFTAGPDGATYVMTLKDAQGLSIASAVGSLGAFGWTQASVADLFPGTAVPADATLLVAVASGTVDVYDASLDNASGDLVVTPIAPVPVAIPSSAQIGPSGGSIRSADGRLTLKVPAGALAAPATLSIAPIENTAPNAIGSAYSLSPVSLAFARPAQVVLSYSLEDLAGTGAGALGIATQEGTGWLAILGGSVDPVARTLSVPVSSTSPGPAPAGEGRTSQGVTQTGVFGPYASIFIHPEKYFVLTDNSIMVDIRFAGPSSTGSVTPGFVTIGSPPQVVVPTWLANGVTGGNNAVGLIFGPWNSAVFRAPHCVRGYGFHDVFIGAFVRFVLDGRPFATYATGTRVRVVERDWMIEVTYRSQSLCSLGFAWSLDYTRSHNGAFSLDDDAKVIDYLAGLNRGQTMTPAWCPGFDPQGCSPLTLTGSPIGDLNLNDVEGRFRDSLLGPAFDLTLRAQIPGTGAFVSFTCPGRTYDYLIPHAVPPKVVEPFLVHYRSGGTFEETRDFVYPGWIESATVKLTPIKPSGCP